MSKKKTNDEFIEELNTLFGDNLNYEKVNYKTNKDKVTIVCKLHGEFEVRAGELLKSVYGCKKCSVANRSYDYNYCISKLENNCTKYNVGYKLDKKDYTGAKSTLVEIVCSKHGNKHLILKTAMDGIICNECLIDNNFETAVKKIETKHSNIKVVSKIDNKRVLANCKFHGDFIVQKRTLMVGIGCMSCKSDNYQSEYVDEYINHNKMFEFVSFDGKYVNLNCKTHGLLKTKTSYIKNKHIIYCNGCKKDEFIHNKLTECNTKYPNTIHKKIYEDKGLYYVDVECKIHGNATHELKKYINRKNGCIKCMEDSIESQKLITNKKISYYKKQKGVVKDNYQPTHNKQKFDEFIQKISIKYPGICDKYDFSKIVYDRLDFKINPICKIHGECNVLPSSINRSGNVCKDCINEEQINNTFLALSTKHPNVLFDIKKYVSYNDEMEVVCKTHGIIYISTKGLQNREFACEKCREDAHLNRFYTKAKKWFPELYFNDREWNGHKKNIHITCPEHGEFKIAPYKLFDTMLPCPTCRTHHNESNGETKIRKYLERNNIKFIQEYRVKPYSYDFYLPDYNTYIEFNGKQHYEPVEKFGGFEFLKISKCRDREKAKIAKTQNRKLLIIPYDKYDNIEIIINDYIKQKESR